MTQLAPDDKTTLVMIYTAHSLVRGEIINKTNVRVSTWLRTQGMPEYIHVHKPQVLSFAGGAPKNLTYSGMLVPTSSLIAFHIAPPAADPMDYEATEMNRAWQPVILHIGTFLCKGKLRVSASTGLVPTLESSRTAWMSVYENEVSNPYLPQMPAIQVPLILYNPKAISLGISE
jgi:hypothetical protein